VGENVPMEQILNLSMKTRECISINSFWNKRVFVTGGPRNSIVSEKR
jgi:hypothetical protein